MLNDLTKTVEEIRQRKYPQARVIFLAGSLVRGEGTSTSDLDLVVLFDQLPAAYRESFTYEGWPVEAFVHDPQTLEYFFREIDRPTGFPPLAHMVDEGIEIPERSTFSDSLKQLASEALEQGPPAWSDQDVRNSRYDITGLVDDLREPRSMQELHATATQLYPALANHYFRSNGLWSAKGKMIPRKLQLRDPVLAETFLTAFDAVFKNGSLTEVISLAEEILAPSGGFLFDGHKLGAPETWRFENP